VGELATEIAQFEPTADDKRQARLRGLQILVEEIGRGAKITEPDLDPAIADAAFKLWGWKEKDSGGKK